MTKTDRAAGDQERYFKRPQGSLLNLNYLTGLLSTAIERDISCDARGLAAALRYIAAEKDEQVWRSSLHVIANALDNDGRSTRLKLVKARAGRAPAKASKGATTDRRSECAQFIFDRIILGQPEKAVKADAKAEFGVSQKTIFVWLKHVADERGRLRRVFDGIYDSQGNTFATDIYRDDPFSLWLEKYESRQSDDG